MDGVKYRRKQRIRCYESGALCPVSNRRWGIGLDTDAQKRILLDQQPASAVSEARKGARRRPMAPPPAPE